MCVGGDPAGRRDPVLFTEARVSCGSSASEEIQDRAGALYDRVVHVRLLAHAAVGISAAHLGHVLLRGLVSHKHTHHVSHTGAHTQFTSHIINSCVSLAYFCSIMVIEFPVDV